MGAHASEALPLLPPEGVDPLSYGVFKTFMRILHLHRQLMLTAVNKGHLAQAGCLRILAARDGITQRDLAEEMHLSRPTVTTMLQALEKEGVVERRTDERDQRLTHVHLTEEGRAREKQVRAGLGRHINETIGEMSEDDRRDLLRLLGVMADNTARALASANATTAERTAS